MPSGYEIVFGDKTRSDIPGYDILTVTFVNGGKQSSANFLISKDCNTLARLEKFDISKDPALTIQVDGTRGTAVAGLRHCWTQHYGSTPRPANASDTR